MWWSTWISPVQSVWGHRREQCFCSFWTFHKISKAYYLYSPTCSGTQNGGFPEHYFRLFWLVGKLPYISRIHTAYIGKPPFQAPLPWIKDAKMPFGLKRIAVVPHEWVVLQTKKHPWKYRCTKILVLHLRTGENAAGNISKNIGTTTALGIQSHSEEVMGHSRMPRAANRSFG